jgi:hypothetical protein
MDKTKWWVVADGWGRGGITGDGGRSGEGGCSLYRWDVCVWYLCVCVAVFGGELHRSRRAVVRSFAGGVSVRARAARVGHWRSSGRAFDQGRASPSRQLYRALHCHCYMCTAIRRRVCYLCIHNNIIYTMRYMYIITVSISLLLYIVVISYIYNGYLNYMCFTVERRLYA